jgi:hypothetical protein
MNTNMKRYLLAVLLLLSVILTAIVGYRLELANELNAENALNTTSLSEKLAQYQSELDEMRSDTQKYLAEIDTLRSIANEKNTQIGSQNTAQPVGSSQEIETTTGKLSPTFPTNLIFSVDSSILNTALPGEQLKPLSIAKATNRGQAQLLNQKIA